ncbi:MAG TPA: hypothetical protein VIC82_04280 [Candidatus Nanopelagicales bacterium]
MARRQPSPQVRTDLSATSATILPGVALPAWAYGPVAPEPELEPVVAAPEPELVYAAVPAATEQSTAPVPVMPLPPPPAAFMPNQPSPVSEPEASEPVLEAEPAPAALAAPSPVDAVEAEAPTYAPDPPHQPTPSELGTVLPGSHRAPSASPEAPAGERNRRPLLLVAGLVVVLLLAAFAAFVTPGFLNSSSDDSGSGVVVTPRAAVVLPATVAGHTKAVIPAAAASSAAAAKALAASGVTSVVAATYVKPGAQTFTLAAGLAPAAAATRATYFTLWAHADGVAKPAVAASGVVSVKAECGTATVAGKATGVCAFVGPKVAGTVTVPGATAAQVAKLLPSLVKVPVVR